MDTFFKSVSQIFEGAAKAFKTFPSAIVSALLFTIVALIRIQMDWPEQEAYNFLFNCLHFSLALGSIFGLTSTSWSKARFEERKANLYAILSTAFLVIITFLLLYFLGGIDPSSTGYRIERLSDISISRVTVFSFISFLLFIVILGKKYPKLNFSRAFFVTHKAFFIALLYGLVILAGASGVAGAIQALLYNNMSEKVYMYIASLSGFTAFAIFVGYFPDTKESFYDEKIDMAKKQPKFIEVLLEFIMVPIFLALTVVLVLWAIRTLIFSADIEFIRLYSISSSYVLWGLWLWILLSESSSRLGIFYKKIYPFAAIFILAFKGWALFLQLSDQSLKTTEYAFILILILSAVSSILLLLKGKESLNKIAVFACILSLVSVLPFAGYHSLPVRFQVSRLEKLLVEENILQGDALVPSESEPQRKIREDITDAVSFLSYSQSKELPIWFDENLGNSSTFEERLGFEQTWPERDSYGGRYIGLNLFLPSGAMDIRDYDFIVGFQDRTGSSKVSLEGERGIYEISWTTAPRGIPVIEISLNNQTILKEDMNPYIDEITERYPPSEASSPIATLDDMSYRFETEDIEVLVIFSSVDIGIYSGSEEINYWLNLDKVYIREKR